MKKKKRSLSTAQTTGRKMLSRSDRAAYDYHLPVMLSEACDYLMTDAHGIYVDGTLGGGGHTAEIIHRLSDNGRLYAFDADSNAIEHCTGKFAGELAKRDKSRLVLCHENYSRACSIKEGSNPFLTGLLLDLGVSSRQLDAGTIGLSYRVNSRLDMRFGLHGQSAEDLLATTEENELERILHLYGEEPYAKKIARRTAERRRAAPLQTTYDLRQIVEDCVPPSKQLDTLSRVFQAFRIAINDELNILEKTLRCIIPLLCPGGRIVVISYHSLEDRIVKTVFKEASQTKEPDPGNPRSTTKDRIPLLHVLTKKPLLPTQEEIARNPRARSAKMRVAEKV